MRRRLLLAMLLLVCLALAVGGWVVEGMRWAPRRVATATRAARQPSAA